MLTVYKASAGSGKTYTLTYEYIKLLLGEKKDNKYTLCKNDRERHRAILAVTFTNKATAEMKQRIVGELALLAGVHIDSDDDSPYVKDLIKEFGCTEEELRQQAYKALNELLFDYGFFSISTIDSFFQGVLRIFAREAELAGNYEVDLDDKAAIMSGVSEMLSILNETPESNNSDLAKRRRKLKRWLTSYMRTLLQSGAKNFNLFNRSGGVYGDIVSLVENMYTDDFKMNSERIMKYLEDESKINSFQQELAKLIDSKTAQMISSAIKLKSKDFDSNVKVGFSRVVEAIANNQMSEIQSKDGSDFLKAALNVGDESLRYPTKVTKKGIPDFDSVFVEILMIYAQIKFLKEVHSNLYVLGLLGWVLKEIEEYRKENNLILLSDTNEILKEIISEDELPFIYERVGSALKHFLVDEFQDTSRMQWENLRPLISESLSHDHDNLIIGDEKQCIYRFRDSDPTLLQSQVGKQFSLHTRERGNDISSNTNWRSSADVVRFNNTLFTAIAKNCEMENLYGNVVQQISPKHSNHKGYILFNPVTYNSREPENYYNEAFELMVTHIKRQLKSGYKQSDIAILVRNGTEGERAIRYLLQHSDDDELKGLKILSDGALKIDNSKAVKLIVSLLRIIDTPDEAVDRRHVTMREVNRILNSYQQNVCNGNGAEDALIKALKTRKEALPIVGAVKSMNCASLSSIVEVIIKECIPAELCTTDNIYISAFQDIVTDYASRGAGDLRSFLKMWDTTGCNTNLTFPDTMDAIKVITMHKSKGLEFRCVHIPVATWDMSKDKDICWFKVGDGAFPEIENREIVPPAIPLQSKAGLKASDFKDQYLQNHNAEIVDELNVTYVAFTRAVDELIVTYRRPSDKGTSKHVGQFIDEAIAVVDRQWYDTNMAIYREQLPPDSNQVFVPLREHSQDGRLEIGQPTIKVEYGNSKKKKTIERIAMPDYYSVIHNDVWNNSELEDFLDITKPRDRGIILHNIMGDVKHLSDIPVAVARHAYRWQLPADEADEICRFLQKAVENEQVKRWFEGYKHIVTERKIMFRDVNEDKEEIIANRRPDRVVWTADGAIEVVDYKFGQPRPQDFDEQVNLYMNKLLDMGYSNIKGFVWYLETGQIVPVKFSPLK